MRALICTSIAVIAVAFVSAASADNYGGVTKQEYQRNAAIVYNAFAGRYGPAVGRMMVRCMNRESGGNPRAWNRTDSHRDRWGNRVIGSFGLLQIGAGHRPAGMTVDQFRLFMWNPYENVKAALALYRSGGIAHWGGGC